MSSGIVDQMSSAVSTLYRRSRGADLGEKNSMDEQVLNDGCSSLIQMCEQPCEKICEQRCEQLREQLCEYVSEPWHKLFIYVNFWVSKKLKYLFNFKGIARYINESPMYTAARRHSLHSLAMLQRIVFSSAFSS